MDLKYYPLDIQTCSIRMASCKLEFCHFRQKSLRKSIKREKFFSFRVENSRCANSTRESRNLQKAFTTCQRRFPFSPCRPPFDRTPLPPPEINMKFTISISTFLSKTQNLENSKLRFQQKSERRVFPLHCLPLAMSSPILTPRIPPRWIHHGRLGVLMEGRRSRSSHEKSSPSAIHFAENPDCILHIPN